MKRLNRVDFIHSSSRPLAGWALVAASAAILAYVGGQLWQVQRQERSLAQRIAATDLSVAASRDRARDAVIPAQVVAVPAAAQVPWNELLAAFDEHATSRIGLMKFEPAPPGHVRVTVRATDTQAGAAFVRRLEADARLKDVTMVEQTAETGSAERAVSITLLAGWRGSAASRDRTVLAR